MDLSAVMDEVAGALTGISGLRVFAYPPDAVTPPAAIVAYPDELNFDSTYGRGMDRLTLPVVVVVGRVSDRSSRDRLAAYCDGSGADSVKAVIEAGSYTALDTVRVMGVEFDVATIAGVDHVAATFTLDIAGKGI